VRLENKVAIISGAGAGIGEATAVRFAEEGARLVLADYDAAAVRAVAARFGGSAIAVPSDISVEADARKISQAAMEAFGAIDIVVNNAANFTTKSVDDATMADWHKVLGVNVIGTSMVSKYAIPHLKARGQGSIVNISSRSGILAQRNFATYNASKGAILTLTRCMALDLAPFKIRVNSICPGAIITTAAEREWKSQGLTREQWIAREGPSHMLNRVGEPREVANAILFLASDESSFVTAAHLTVDGGCIWQ
jgi:NAD(P)-dependent dehydrogenase (short-subunit alcohol dehydrogenase family)